MSKIEWTGRSWNPIVGCSVVSPGCTNCYAMKMAARLERMQPGGPYDGTTQSSKAGPVWTGKVALAPEKTLTAPLRRKKPTVYFVNSMGDLFHEAVPDDWIDRVFAIISLAPQHTFQVLTKRSARMREYMAFKPEGGAARRLFLNSNLDEVTWPPPNVWLGVSAERQEEADVRIPDLLATPAAVRFVSVEPLLGAIDLRSWLGCKGLGEGCSCTELCPEAEGELPSLDWVIAGGESGLNARPMHPAWARALRDQCASAGVPFFFKQWGAWGPAPAGAENPTHCEPVPGGRRKMVFSGSDDGRFISHRDGGKPLLNFVGKKRAGRLLDGRAHDELPGGVRLAKAGEGAS